MRWIDAKKMMKKDSVVMRRGKTFSWELVKFDGIDWVRKEYEHHKEWKKVDPWIFVGSTDWEIVSEVFTDIPEPTAGVPEPTDDVLYKAICDTLQFWVRNEIRKVLKEIVNNEN